MKRLNIKTAVIVLLILSLLVNSGYAEVETLKEQDIDWEAQGFTRMKTTAYCMGHHTAMGIPVHEGIAAASADHLRDVAIVYTTGGNFLGYYYCCDTGGTEGIQNGYVIDIYRRNLTQATSYMKITRGEVYVKWIKGEG